MNSKSEMKLLEFHEMGLDDRILKAISKQGWAKPTAIQERAIPLALEGKDIMAHARTGSGKTAAFVVPILQKILSSKQTATEQCVKAVVMTPSKELCQQAYRVIKDLTCCCSREVKFVDVSPLIPLDTQRKELHCIAAAISQPQLVDSISLRPMLAEQPDIVIGTPSRLLAHLQAGNLKLKDSLEMIVIDEADLVFSFGHEDNVKAILEYMPKIYQAFLMSATLEDDVKTLKKMVLHNAVILRLNESDLPDESQLTQYHLKCEEADKYAILYALLKLQLVQGKTLIFVNSVDKGYRLRLFLEQFGIRPCVLNPELPVNSRCHIVSQFNEGVYDILLACDENLLNSKKGNAAHNLAHSKRKRDKEFGASRGLDFQNVTNVINFDFPTTVKSYVHRVGRTARGINNGTALSFISVDEMSQFETIEKALMEQTDSESPFKPYQFKMEEIEGFRYRAKDARQAVTRVAVREARLKEIRQEMLNSEKLKSYFQDNPRDLQVLRHDKNLRTVNYTDHLKHVPNYLVPTMLKDIQGQDDTDTPSTSTKTSHKPKMSAGEKKYKKRKADPLKSFEFEGLSKAKKKKVWKKGKKKKKN